jgi:hypothetical protein
VVQVVRAEVPTVQELLMSMAQDHQHVLQHLLVQIGPANL